MKKLIVFLMGLVLLATSGVASAASYGKKKSSDNATKEVHSKTAKHDKEKKGKKENKNKKEKKHKKEAKKADVSKSDKDMDVTPVTTLKP